MIADLSGPNGNNAVGVNGAPHNGVARVLSDGHAFPGNGCLVDACGSCQNDPVDGDFFAWFHPELVADLNLVERDGDKLPLAENRGVLGLESE